MMLSEEALLAVKDGIVPESRLSLMNEGMLPCSTPRKKTPRKSVSVFIIPGQREKRLTCCTDDMSNTCCFKESVICMGTE